MNPEQAAEAERLLQVMRPTVVAELRHLTRLLASQPDHQLLGKIEYVSVDATGVGVQGPRGAKAEGRMVWVGKVFNPRPEPSESCPKPFPPWARYQAGLMDLDDLGVRLRRQAAQVGLDRAERWVALTDGGNGLDDFMDVFFPRAVRILDFYHVAEHLGDLAKAYRGPDADAAEELTATWSHQRKHEGARRRWRRIVTCPGMCGTACIG